MWTLVPGESFKVVPVAKAKTDNMGNFELRVAGSSVRSHRSTRSAVVDYELAADGVTPYYFSAVTKSDGTLSDRGPYSIELRPDKSASAPVESVAKADSGQPIDKQCGIWDLVQTYSPEWDIVGQTYLAASGVTADFVYSSGASTELGIKVSVGGTANWTSQGTNTRSSTASVSFPAVSGTTYRYRKTQF
jgi:hypothetical protein